MNKFKMLAGVAVYAALAAVPAMAASITDIQGVQAAKVSLSDAIDAAQKSGDGKAIFGKYHTMNGAGQYEVVVVAGGKTNTMDVDPTTGEAVKAKRDDAAKSDKKGVEAIEGAQTPLDQAIATAEKQGGKALEAELDTKKGMTAYEIEIANGDKTDTVWIDVNSGEIIKKS
jgi:uncharacterized membrane protein YkoI